MKKIFIYMLLILLVPLSALADGTCTHKRWTCKEDSSYKLYFECDNCHQRMDIENWKTNEDYGISVVDPYLDVEADVHNIGQEKMIVTGENSFLQAWLIGSEKKDLLAYVNQYSKPTSVLNFTLPWTPKACKATLVVEFVVSQMSTETVETADGPTTKVEMQSDTIFATKNIEYKPFHSIAAMDVTELKNVDNDGLIKPSNQVRFWIQAPQDADIMDSDAFVIYRYKKNPSHSTGSGQAISGQDEVNILSQVDITKPDTIITVNGVKYGEYRYIDTDEESHYGIGETTSVVDSEAKLYANCDSINKLDKAILDGFYTHPTQNVYYGVMRALVNSIWPSHSGTFMVEDSVNVCSQLPSVSKVKIEQHGSWMTDKTSDIRITLDNPLPWEYNELMDANMVHEALAKRGLNYRRYVWDENAKIRVLRSSPKSEWYGNEDPAAAEFLIAGTDVKWNAEKGAYEAVLEDMQALPYTHYYYTAEVIQDESNILVSGNNSCIKTSEEDANLCYSAVAALIGNFTASRDKYPGAVLLKWKLGSGKCDNVLLCRRQYSKEGNGDWDVLTSLSPTDVEYMDETALAGYAYDYKLMAQYVQGTHVLADSCKVIGWGSFRSSISGHLLMPNGTGMAGERVIITRTDPIYISDVVDSLGYIIMPGYHDGVIANAPALRSPEVETDTYNELYRDTIYTDASGAFTFDKLLYKGDGTEYKITLPGIYDYNGTAVPSMSFKLSNELNVLKDERFVLNDVATVSGRVLFSESTIPVRDAYFILNDKTVLTTVTGDSIKTDANGKFELTIPANTMVSLRIMKEGHTFANDGYIKKDFTAKLNEEIVIPQVQDYTRVRLVGRLAGGNVQADKQLGFSMSKNNLGDNPTIVLELEGNSTSWLVYKKENPEDTNIKATVKHPFAGLYLGKELKTEVSYEKKRIVINPDPLSGEFFVDLIPTTYKVTQLSTEGYSTLYSKGEGLDVIDLGADITEKVDTSKTDGNMQYTYNAKYIRTYHVPATVTYQQLKYGTPQKFFGEGEVSIESITGSTMDFAYGSYDEAKRETHYLFGYPVFDEKSRYFLKAYAHEDYYYNNDQNRALDQVPVSGGTLHVQNGLLASDATSKYELDSLGTTTFAYNVGNPHFNLTDTAALRSLNMSVELNGLYYEAEPLRGFVIGSAKVGADALPLCSATDTIRVVDVLRDPPGSSSYAYRKKGTEYHWDIDLFKKQAVSLNLSISAGASWKTEVVIAPMGGGANQTITEGSIGVTANCTVNFPSYNERTHGQYTMTLNEEVRTSDDPLDVGAMADVYIGTVNMMDFYKTKAISVISKEVYNLAKAAIDEGAVKVVKASADGSYYLVIGSQLALGTNVERTFVYSQKHILGTVIPELRKMRQALLEPEIYVAGNDAKYQNYAKTQKRDVYVMDKEGEVHWFAPGDNTDKIYKNRYQEYDKMITQWKNVIYDNEKEKVDLITPSKKVNYYSVAGTAVTYEEEASGYCVSTSWWGKVSGSAGISGNSGIKQSDQDKYEDKKDEKGNDKPVSRTDVSVAGVNFGISGGLSYSPSSSSSKNFSKTKSTGYGFYMATNDNGYMDVDIYADQLSTKEATTYDLSSVTFKNSGASSTDVDSAKVHGNYVFYVRGGAARNPWYAADKTLYYNPGTPLGETMLKIDKPRLVMDKTVVNNMPEDEKAVFKIKVINDTEYEGDVTQLKPSFLMLYVADDYNPNGAKFYMDGMPLTMGKEFDITPGTTQEKTFEIERGAGYDFENLKLILRDQTWTLADTVTMSVHYLPVASPIAIATPEDKWTMNTLSAQDADGKYYIPVSLNGFNVNSDGFHHIELQYKKETEGESKWTKVCSFFTDEALMAEATGDKELIPSSGKIQNIRFYGDQDPVEMNYDLRAVTFRKLGTGFITRESNVVKGTKDTRCPTVFGSPSPANGILTYSDVITIPFNEPIAYNYLDETANFQVTGYTNSSESSYATALSFPTMTESSLEDFENDTVAYYNYLINKSTDIPTTKVSRNMSGNDFTIDAMVKFDSNDNINSELFSIYSDDALIIATENCQPNITKNFLDFVFVGKQLAFLSDGYAWYSEEINNIDFSAGLNRYGVTFKQPTDDSPAEVNFYVNGLNIPVHNVYTLDGSKVTDRSRLTSPCTANGKVRVGRALAGCMTDVRVWNRVLPDYEMTQKRYSRLSSNELGLVAYWPLNEGSGQVAHDEAYGADFYFTHQSWMSTTPQYSLRIDGESVQLSNAENIMREQSYDYTLSLWARIDKIEGDSVDVFRCGEWYGKQFFRIGTTKDGYLALRTKNDEIGGLKTHNIVPSAEFGDNDWHNVIVVATKSQNQGAIYYDGNLVTSFNGTELGGLASTNIKLGGEGFYGNLDNITAWDHAFPSNSISTLYNRTASGYEMGLRLNLPFEMSRQNYQGEYETQFCGQNIIYKLESRNESGTYPVPDSVFVFADDAAKDAFLNVHADHNDYCPLEPTTGMQNLKFNWTATDNSLQINLLQNDADINHQNISVVVRGVEDLAGNTLQNAQRLVLYIDKNVLRWNDKRIILEKPYLEGKTCKVKFNNESGRRMSYNLYEYCSWMTLDKSQGYIDPLDEVEVEVTFDEGMAPGQYYSTIYLRDEDDLYAQLPIVLNVVAEEPEWEVTTDVNYKQQMSVTGQVRLKNEAGIEYVDIDKRDILYAFCDGVCLGKANITVEDNDAYVYITIKGKESMNKQTDRDATEITFRLWRASTGNVSYLGGRYTDMMGNEHATVRFAKNTSVGTHSSPVIFRENGYAVQTLSLKKGWNWVSLNVKPELKQDKGVDGLFESTSMFSLGDMINVLGSDASASMQDNGLWSEGMDNLSFSQDNVYQIWAQEDCEPRVIGAQLTDENRFVTLHKQGWNDLAYLYDTDKPLALALADYMQGNNAMDGTVIMSRNQFAQVDKGKWYGSLEYMHPGQGYYLYHRGVIPQGGLTIHYYDNTTPAGKVARKAKAATFSDEETSLSRDYQSNMAVVAKFAETVDFQQGDQLVAYAACLEQGRRNVVVGRAEAKTLDDGRTRFFITLSAQTGTPITWAQERDGETIAKAKSNVNYRGMTIAGSINKPLTIDFLAGQDNADSVDYYSVSGMHVDKDKVHNKVLIGNDGTKIIKK